MPRPRERSAGRKERRSVGSEVQALSEQLSDDLLVLENSAFAELEFLFVSQLDSIETLMRSRTRPRDLANDEPFLAGMGEIIIGVAGESGAVVLELFEQSADITTHSIMQELELCEQTMAKRYAGSHLTGMKAVDTETLIAKSGDNYRDHISLIAGRWIGDLSQQLQYAETSDEAVERVISTQPLNLTGNQGRGVWWRALTSFQRLARETSIELVNTIRSTAIEAMNDANRRS